MSETTVEFVPPPTAWRGQGGRKALGWIGGAKLMDEVEHAPEGKAVRMAIPKGVPYNRIRFGIYKAAQKRNIAVHVVRQNGSVHVWRVKA